MTILLLWSGETIMEAFGPFASDDEAREWGEEMFPNRHFTTEDVRSPR